MKRKRVTIGVLVSGILDEFTKYVCKGVLQEAKAADANVVIIPGKYLDRDLSGNRELMYEYQYSTTFSYIREGNIDVLIIAAGTIGCFTTEKRMMELFAQYGKIPCVSLTLKLSGYPYVVFDNYQGIKEGLEYLITCKGCRKFGMVGGSLENLDAYERKQTFMEVLASHGILFTEKMYVEGEFSRRSVKAYQKLLDDNPDLEAVFCINDDTTIGLYEELRRRGIKVGRDIYVFGYDDSVAAAKINPSLSSVRADTGKMGEEAVRLAIRMVRGEQVEGKIVPTHFVRRNSVSNSWEEEETGIPGLGDGATGFEDVFYWCLHEEMQEEIDHLRVSYEKMIRGLLKGFGSDSDYLEECLGITRCVDEFLNLGGAQYADMDKLMIIFEGIYRKLREKQADDKSRFELRNFFTSIYKKIISAMNQQLGSIKENADRESYAMKLFVQNVMQFENGREQSYGPLLANMEWLNVKNACIYMFPSPQLHLHKEQFRVPSSLQLKAVLRDGRIDTIPADQQKQSIRHIFDNAFLPADRRFERVLLPLFSNEMVYGVLLCDMAESLYLNGEFLVNQISSAIKMLMLLRTNEDIQQQLEENVAALKAHNIELDNISKSDMLTSILNRRGFYEEAKSMIAQCRREAKKTIVLYVDMNNLKIINDRYGHDEGDFALKLIGRFLTELVDSRGIAGRIGGDEYACVMEYRGWNCTEDVISELYQKFEMFNADSDKLYNVTVSAGAYILAPGDAMSLEDAMNRADEKLYMEKQHRKKEVAKI